MGFFSFHRAPLEAVAKEASVRRMVRSIEGSKLARRGMTAVVMALPLATLSAAMAGGPVAQPKAGDPLVGLTPAQLALFNAGKALYGAPLSTENGLGPIFNKAGCFSCHANPLGGWGSITVTRFGFEDNKGNFDPLEGLGGSLQQVSAISSGCEEVVPPEANVTALRLTNSSMAFGLIEAIPDAAIAANDDPNDLNGDGISGRVRWEVPFESSKPKVGRFGWKAQVPTVLTFSADASRNEMGLTNRFVTTENAPNGDMVRLAQCDNVPDPEDHPDAEGYAFIDRVTHFQRYLGIPPQTPKSGMTGETVFNAIGCAKCHIASWTTSNNPGLETAIRSKTIRPYSDFLLHEMGTLADNIPDGFATGGELRTPTLWNLRTRDPMLHNGSASSGTFQDRVTAAIVAHGPFGEGAAAAAAFQALNSTEQGQLIAFLDSLGRLEFDMDGDGHRDILDYFLLRDCMGSPVTPDDACAVADVDQDGDIDGTDLDVLQTVYEGDIVDCNSNGMWDIKEILLGLAPDKDGDGAIDGCTPCLGDLNGSGAVDAADLAILLGAWGTSSADLDGDSVTSAPDLGILLGAWGACP